MPKKIEANTAASFVLSVIVLYLALVALYSTNLSIQSLSVNYAPEPLLAGAGYGETPLSAADIAMNSTLAPNINHEPVTAARVPFLKRLPVPLVIFLLSLVIHLSLRPRWLLKFAMYRLLPSLVSIIAFIASVPKFCLLSVFKILPRLRVGLWVSEWARFISSRELPLASPIIGTFVLGSTLVRVLFRHLHTLAWNLLAATTKYFRVYLLCYLMPTFLSIARQVVSFVREIVTCHLVPSFFSSALEFFTWVSREVPLAKVLFHYYFHQRHILAWDLLVVFFMVTSSKTDI